MAIQTPLHVQGLCLPRQWHLVDPTVTGFAADSFMYVDTMVEINKVRQVVYARPLERSIFSQACSHRFESWTVRPHLFMAVHADFCGRNPRERASLDADMTISAIYAETGYMVLMAEWYRLLTDDILVADVRGGNKGCPGRHYNYNDKDSTEDREPRNRVGTAMKDLRHAQRLAMRMP